MATTNERKQPLSLLDELKRRSVFKVTTAYGLVAWLVAQLAEFATETFGAPDWVLRTFVILLLLGLPIAIILAWAFDLTPAGLRKTSDGDGGVAKAKGTNAQARIPAKEKAGSSSQKRPAKNLKMDNGRQCPKKIIKRLFSFFVPCFFSSG